MGFTDAVNALLGRKSEDETVLMPKKKRETLFTQLSEATAFKKLIMTDTLNERRDEITEAIKKIAKEIGNLYDNTANGNNASPQKIQAALMFVLGDIHAAYFNTTSPYARSRDDEFFDELYTLFLDRCRAFGDVKKALIGLFMNFMRVVNLAFTNRDVEPPPPIIIHTMEQRGQYPPTTFNQPKDMEYETQKWGKPKYKTE